MTNFQFSFTAKSNDQFMMHPAKKGINLVHCFAYRQGVSENTDTFVFGFLRDLMYVKAHVRWQRDERGNSGNFV